MKFLLEPCSCSLPLLQLGHSLSPPPRGKKITVSQCWVEQDICKSTNFGGQHTTQSSYSSSRPKTPSHQTSGFQPFRGDSEGKTGKGRKHDAGSLLPVFTSLEVLPSFPLLFSHPHHTTEEHTTCSTACLWKIIPMKLENRFDSALSRVLRTQTTPYKFLRVDPLISQNPH